MREADVFIHVEGNNVFKSHSAGFVCLNQFLVHSDRGRTRGKAEHKGFVTLVGIDCFNDMLCRPAAHIVIVFLNNNFHRRTPLQ